MFGWISTRPRLGGCNLAALLLPACAGNPAISVPLTFVRFEPYVLPKRSLTGDTTERVDTRVLQAIYKFAPGEFPAFVGQQVDVFIEAPSRDAATRSPTSGQVVFTPVAETPAQMAGGASRTVPR